MQSISNPCVQNSFLKSHTQRKHTISKLCVQNVLQKQECAGNYSDFTIRSLQSLHKILADKGDACRTGATVDLSNYYKSLDLQVIVRQCEQHLSWGCVFKASRVAFLTSPPEQLRKSQTARSLWSRLYWYHEKRSLTSGLCEQCL